MTSPGGSEHISRYRALGEFDNLIRAAREARNELRKLREEEAKLNAQSLADDKKITASKLERAKAEKANADAAKNAAANLNNNDAAGKSGEGAGVAYSRGIGKGIQKEIQSGANRQFVDAATKALQQAFAEAGRNSGRAFTKETQQSIKGDGNTTSKIIVESVERVREAFQKMGDEAGTKFHIGVRERFRRDKSGVYNSSGFEYSLREFVDRSQRAGEDSGSRYIMGFGDKIRRLNEILPLLGFDKLDLDVGIEDAQQSIKALEFELTRLANTTTEPRVRIDTNRALGQLRGLQKLFKDEVAEAMLKDTERIRKELEKVDQLPSGKAFKFWALTAMSDMAKVFEEAERGTSVFTKLRLAAAGGGSGGGGNFLRSLVSGFDDFSESSSNLLQRLSRVSGELYRMPGIIAVLVASLPALISGLGALAGGALGLSSGLGAALGIVAAFPAAALGLTTAVGALSGVFEGMGEAIKAAQKAQEAEAEAKEKSRLGTDKALTAQQKYALALSQLGPATEAVTKAVVDFGEKWSITQKKVSENFFKQVAKDTGDLNTLLPILEDLLGRAASALGKVASAGINMITSGPWKADFQKLSKANATNLEDMGFAGLELAEAFKDIAVAAIPFTTWLVRSIREGAEAFGDWAANARGDGTIEMFLGETQESLQSLWQIFKNLGNVVNSFFKSTVDEGQTYLRTLEEITGHWADVAKAQEQANSPLRQWMVQIRPILSSLGALIGDVARGIAGLATNQNSVQSMISLLDTLRTDVLPPILSILQHLNDSGIAVTVVEALGTMLKAISTFLESGATQALTVFVVVLAEFVELLFSIASLPGISNVLGAVATGIAAIAAVSIVARFTGLFKLWDFFTWMSRNRGNLSGAFSDAARGIAGLPTTGQTNIPANVPSSIGGIGSEVRDQSKTFTNTGNAAQNAAPKVNAFSRAMAGVSTAGNNVRGALGSFTAFLGGPWGIAITAAITGVTLLSNYLIDQKKDADDTKAAFQALRGAYKELQGGDTSGIQALAETNDKLKEIIDSANIYKISLTDVSGALGGQDQALNRVNSQLDAQIAILKENAAVEVKYINGRAVVIKATHDAAIEAERYKQKINEVANEQDRQNGALQQATSYTKTYQERLGGLTQAQVDSVVKVGELDGKIRLLSGALDTLSSATASNESRSRALSDLIQYQVGPLEAANEATETFRSSLLDLSDAVEANGRSLDVKTRAGLRNRDALQAAAKATRDLYLQDIASGTPMDQATKRHQDRIRELQKEADKTFKNKEEVKKLISVYGDVPDNLKTNILTDEKGFAAVYVELSKLAVMQKALQEGKSIDEAQKAWNKESSKFYQRYIPGVNGDGYGIPKYATGGPVWGAGTRTSDSIQAWLSNGEFVQPTDAVEHYGMPIMEALRTKKLDKVAIQEALPSESGYASGGSVHSEKCVSCQSGGHKFATGGSVRVPIVVNPRGTMVDKNWVTGGGEGGPLGGMGGGMGYQWQMRVLRQAFPGLELWSGYRPGSRTLSGNRSYHSLGRAVDIAPRRDVTAWIRANYGGKTKELITPFNDLNIHNGKPHRYTGAVWNQHNFAGGNAHTHWAFNQGGLVDLMKMLNMDNLAPSINSSLPTTPRTLSPAASSVVNNTTDKTTTFGDIIINNPTAERGGDSIRNALYRTQLLL
jgi:uncharacterized membrane protein (DUF106 family)